MKQLLHLILPLAVLALFFASCTKDVDIPFPDAETKTVVDGSITLGQPAFLFLTRSQSFNEPLDPSSLTGIFETDATVQLSNGTDTVELAELCAGDLSPEDLVAAAELLGIDPETLSSINYCVYTNPLMIGEINTDYFLDITTNDGRVLTAETRIGEPLTLDSLWFEYWAASDSLGFAYGIISDPAEERNAYRWRAQRINSYANGEQKDQGMVAPLGSHVEDRFWDGLTFEFVYNRGTIPNSNKPDDNNAEAGFFKLNDTLLVEFSTTTLDAFNYWVISDDQLVNNGSPFAVPANVPSNITGGLGLWAGYAPSLDTLICVP